MLEIFGLITLANATKRAALERGRKPGGFVALTLCLWIGVEAFLLILLGTQTDIGLLIYVIALPLSVGAGFIGFAAAKRCKMGNYAGSGAQSSQVALQGNTTNIGQTNAVICPICGAKLPGSPQFCGKCGFDLSAVRAQTGAFNSQPVFQEASDDIGKPSMFSKVISIITMVLACLLTICVLGFGESGELDSDIIPVLMGLGGIPCVLFSAFGINSSFAKGRFRKWKDVLLKIAFFVTLSLSLTVVLILAKII